MSKTSRTILREAEDLVRERPFPAENGVVESINQDGVAICRLPEPVPVNSVIRFPGGLKGLVLSLFPDETLGVILMGDPGTVVRGDPVWLDDEEFSIQVGEEMFGRVVNAIGEPIDGKGPIKTSRPRLIENKAYGVLQRQNVNKPVMTGYLAVDTMTQIGRGQRELIIGDRQIGRTALVLDAIINQRDSDIFCIYVAIGQRMSQVKRIVGTLREHGAMDHTVVMLANARESAALQYIAPFAGCAIGEDVMVRGGHALIIYDDLTKHSWAYRQISLLLRRPPGREAFPGDIFYLHARLLERAAALSDKLGGGTLTALPIIETQLNDVAAYIPTNVISITDGQIYLDETLFNSGLRPAISPGISVSRVGAKAMYPALKRFSGGFRIDMAEFMDVKSVAQMDAEIQDETRRVVERGERLTELLKQKQFQPLNLSEQTILMFAVHERKIDNIPVDKVEDWKNALLEFFRNAYPDIIDEIKSTEQVSDELFYRINKAYADFLVVWEAGTP